MALPEFQLNAPHNVLVVQASARTDGSHSRRLVNEFVEHLKVRGAAGTVAVRDLATQPVSLLKPGITEVIRSKDPDAAQRDRAVESERLIDELKAADLLVLGVPMYNWNIPAALKAWLDQIVRVNYTFGHGTNGLEGLLGGKPAVAVLSRGGVYSTPDRAPRDFQKPYLELMLRAIGIVPEFVLCEGTALGDEPLNRSLAEARAALRNIAVRIG